MMATNYSSYLLTLEAMVLPFAKRNAQMNGNGLSPFQRVSTPIVPGRPGTPQNMQPHSLTTSFENELSQSMNNRSQSNPSQIMTPSPILTSNTMNYPQSNQVKQQQALQSVINQQVHQIQSNQYKAQMKVQQNSFSTLSADLNQNVQQNSGTVQPEVTQPKFQAPQMHQAPVVVKTETEQPPAPKVPKPYMNHFNAPAKTKATKKVIDPLAGFEIKSEPKITTELSEDEKKYYFARTRKLVAYGGVDLLSLGPALQRMRASKELYGNGRVT
jgi:hypothetical protein